MGILIYKPGYTKKLPSPSKTNELAAAMKRAGYKKAYILDRSGKGPAPGSSVVGTDLAGNYRSEENPRIGGWPATWHVVKSVGLSYGCGNSHQAQLHLKSQDQLIPSVHNFVTGEAEYKLGLRHVPVNPTPEYFEVLGL